MSDAFQRSLSEIAADHPRNLRILWICAVVLIGGWLAWLFGAAVPVYATTDTARVETLRAAHRVSSPFDGKVVAVHVVLGQKVERDAAILELDAEMERLRQREGALRSASAADTTIRLREELALQTGAADRAAEADAASIREQIAKTEEAVASSRTADAEAKRAESLFRQGVLSAADRERLGSEAERSQAAVRAEQANLRRLQARVDHDRVSRHVALEQLRTKLRLAESEASTSQITTSLLEEDVQRRVIRAPVAGTVAEHITAREGSVVQLGEKLTSIVPAGTLLIVAQFRPADAFGRVREGQRARARLATANWLDYGTLNGTVRRVAREATEGHVRVEIEVDPTPASRALEHGMPLIVDVEVERLSPARLIVRSVGGRIMNGGQPQS